MNQRFVKNWKLSVMDNLTTAAVYSSKEKIYASVKNNNVSGSGWGESV